jgi:hypothetical protein
MKKMSKCMSFLMALAMMLLFVPSSVLAAGAGSKETATVVKDDSSMMLITNTVDEKAVPEQAQSEKTTDATVVQPQLVTDTPVLAGDKIVDQASVPEQPVTLTNEAGAADTETVTTQTASYLCLTQNGVVIDVLAANTGADYDYDAAANQLTLNNFVGEELNAISVADTFKLVLLGTNVLKTNNGFAVNVTGDMNLSGNGMLVASGQSTAVSKGGGINVIGDLVIDSGTYDITATGNDGSRTAVGIMTGEDEGDITPGNLIINGGNLAVTAVNTGFGSAFGLFAFGNQSINGGTIDVSTECTKNYSTGIGADYGDLVFNGGYTVVNSVSHTGEAAALFSNQNIIINNGILDLHTSGVLAQAFDCEGSLYINPCYGNVNRSASSLYLEPLACKSFVNHHAASENPKTGVENKKTDVLIAVLGFISMLGLAVMVRKRDVNV